MKRLTLSALALVSAIGIAHAETPVPMASSPEEVGLSSVQLKKLEAVTKQQIDDGLWRLPNASGSVAKSLTPHVRVSDVIVARGLTLRGVGFAILPEAICRRDVEQGRLVRVLHNWEIPPLIPAATFLEHRYMPLRVRTFLDTLAAKFKAELDVDELY